MAKEQIRYSLFFAFLGGIFFLPFLGGVHLFDWDEINFAEISREMLIKRDYLRIYVNFLPFWEKPPFFFWLQVLAMKLVGVNEYAARLPNAIIGIATLVLLYNMGRQLFNHRFGVIWAGVYFGTVLPFLYSKSGIIDPVFNFFIFLGLYLTILFYWKKDGFEGITLNKNAWLYLFLGGFSVGVAILTKGQVAYLITILTFFVYWVYKRFYFYINVPQFLFFTFAATLVTLSWYGLETMKNGTWFIEEFNKYQYRLFSTPDAGHKGFFGYHFAVLLVGCFPASIFLIRSFFKMPEKEWDYQKDFTIWMKMLFWVVLILFSIVKSKIVHYSSMCYFPLTFLTATVIYEMINGKVTFNRWMKVGLWFIGGLFIFATIAMPIIGQDPSALIPLFDDPFAVANLEAEINWTGLEVIPGVLLFGVILTTIILFRRNHRFRSFQVLFLGTGLFVMLTLIFFIKRIEGYSQRAAIEFFESKVDEDCYIISHGYKTYGHLFYAKKPLVENEKSYDKEWLLRGDVDKSVYVITKIHKADELRGVETLEELGAKNGFVFFKRKP